LDKPDVNVHILHTSQLQIKGIPTAYFIAGDKNGMWSDQFNV